VLGYLNSIDGGMSDGCKLGPLNGRELSQTDDNSLGVKHGCNDGLELGPMLGWVEGTPDVTRLGTEGSLPQLQAGFGGRQGLMVLTTAWTNAATRASLMAAGLAEWTIG